MININDFRLTTNKVMLGETLATQYIWTDENGNKVAEFKKAHVGKGPEDPYYGSICFLDGTNQILSRGQIFGSTYKLLNSQAEYDNLKAEDKLDEYTLYLIKETE